MTNKTGKALSPDLRVYLVGGGIASMAAAAYFIRDGKIKGNRIRILERSDIAGGSLDGAGSAVNGYTLRGGRMLNFSYLCTYDLLSFIPSLSDPAESVLDEIKAFNNKIRTGAKARLLSSRRISDVSSMGFSNKDRLDLVEMMAVSEDHLSDRRIDTWFSESFFGSNFWYMWATMFAFQPWHSAVEFKRYLHRFLHEFERINTLSGVDRTPFNQYDSIVRPLVQWLTSEGVLFEFGTEVTNLSFQRQGEIQRVTGIHYTRLAQQQQFVVTPDDLVLVTLGSMTADAQSGSMNAAPAELNQILDPSWKLWENIAESNKAFGRPYVFDTRVEESNWESFTVTSHGKTFFDLMEKFSGNSAGTGALTTLKESNWLLSVVLPYQPHFIGQPENVTVFWGYGLFTDRPGNLVKKKMSDCSGKEIMEEVLFHLPFNEEENRTIMEEANCIPCMMPYITSQFLTRSKADRPEVIPVKGSNLAFIGQFVEVPDDVVFTVEYSVRTAQTAVYGLLEMDQKPIEMYKGGHHLNVLLEAAETLVR